MGKARSGPHKGKPTSGLQDTFPGAELPADAVELALAMDRYKRENRRPFPTWAEVLEVAKGLGYRKINAGEAEG